MFEPEDDEGNRDWLKERQREGQYLRQRLKRFLESKGGREEEGEGEEEGRVESSGFTEKYSAKVLKAKQQLQK